MQSRPGRIVSFLARGIAAAGVGVVFPLLGLAAEQLPPSRSFANLRALGLGVTPVALQGLSHGSTSGQNPAWVGLDGKARQKETLRSLYFPEVTAGANGTTRSLAKAYFNGQGSTQQSIEDFLKAAKNEQTPYGFFELAPSLSFLRFQMAMFARVEVEGYVWSRSDSSSVQADSLETGDVDGIFGLTGSDSQMLVRAEILRGARLAFSIPYKNTGVYLGLQARPTWRSEYSGDVSLSEPLAEQAATELKAKFNESSGIPLDLAATIRLARVKLMPTVGVMVDDFSDTLFKANKNTHQSLIQRSNLKIGASVWAVQGKSVAIQCTVAGHHLNDERVSGVDKVGVACESHIRGNQEADMIVNAPMVLRFGWNSRGVSYGGHWNSPLGLVEIASAPVRVLGPAGFSERLDQRYFVKLSVDVSGP
ncbi:MAG: hypothetical protein RJB13_1247 [Pseudomonadota bacterium]